MLRLNEIGFTALEVDYEELPAVVLVGDAHGAGRHAQGVGRLLGRQSDDHAQDQDLPLLLREHVEQRIHPGGGVGVDGELFGTSRDVEPLRHDLRGLGPVPGGGTVRVSNLVRRNAVHESKERTSLIPIPRQRHHGGQANLLSHVVS